MVNTAGKSYKVYAATTADELEKLRPFWMTVNRHPDADIDFYSSFIAARAALSRPHILVATEDGHPKAMLIGRLETTILPIKIGYLCLMKLKLRQLSFLNEGYVGDCSPEIVQAVVQEVLNSLSKGRADRALLSNVHVNTEIHRLAKASPRIWLRGYSHEISQRWRTKLPGNIDEFLKRRSKKHRYWLRRIARVFEEDHKAQVTYRTYEVERDVHDFCSHAEKVAQSTYQRAMGVGFIDKPETRHRLELAAERKWLKAYVAFLHEEPLAFWCGWLYKGVMYLDSTGYKPSYRQYELGTLLFLKMAEDLCHCGASEIDFGSGASFYKERFGDIALLQESINIYAPTMKGLTANALKTVETLVNRSARAVAESLGVVDRVKKYWRRRLASGVRGELKSSEGSITEPWKD